MGREEGKSGKWFSFPLELLGHSCHLDEVVLTVCLHVWFCPGTQSVNEGSGGEIGGSLQGPSSPPKCPQISKKSHCVMQVARDSTSAIGSARQQHVVLGVGLCSRAPAATTKGTTEKSVLTDGEAAGPRADRSFCGLPRGLTEALLALRLHGVFLLQTHCVQSPLKKDSIPFARACSNDLILTQSPV